MGAMKWVGIGFGLTALGAAVVYAQYRNIEQPAYEVVESAGALELRDYASMVVAEVTHSAPSREAASGASFRRLAAYIFANDRPAGGESIAMTAPVLQDQPIDMTSPVIQERTEANTWRMRFVMPSQYTLDTLPQAPADITLTEVAERRVAAISFNGYGGSRDLELMEARLREWMAGKDLRPAGPVEYAFYDAPMVPGPLRRNEVLLPVQN